MIPFQLEPSWEKILWEELNQPYLLQLAAFVKEERRSKVVYPPEDLVFEAFRHTPYDKVRVVIVGQDPYHGPGQAHGLSFSVPQGVAPPPSLVNIFKEMRDDLGGDAIPKNGTLTDWADQGVFLLNALLTVRGGEPLSHQGRGWERFTDKVIEVLAKREDPIVFILWGKTAKDKFQRIAGQNVPRGTKHLVITSAHPSPLSCHQGFFGSRPFSKANAFLLENGLKSINWNLDNCFVR